MKPSNPLLQKQALDPWFEQINEPDYAEHQHHSDPSYTTQNGKDYAGRGTTENEEGALQDGIPAGLLSVELGKSATAASNYEEVLNQALEALETLAQVGPSEDIKGCASMTAGDLRQFAEDYKAGRARRFSSDVDNPSVTTMPSAPAPVDPDNAKFFKESDPMSNEFSPAEEKINGIVGGEGFHYGARVTDGTTLWFRGSNERLSFDPKTGNVSYLRNGKVELECPVDQLQKNVGRMLKSSAREFHETLKKALGQTAAIRPSPTKVFEDKVDNATGKQPVAPTEPSDDDVMKAKMTLENAGVGDQIGVNAANPNMTVQKWRRSHPKEPIPESERRPLDPFIEWWVAEIREGRTYNSDMGEARRAYDNLPTKDAAVTKTYGTGTPPGGTPNDPSVDVEEEDEGKTSSQKQADVSIHETPKFLPPRDDIRRHLDEDVQDEVMEGVMDGVKDKTADAIEGEVVRGGNWKLYAFPVDTPLGQYGEIKRPVPPHSTWYVGDKAKALPIVQDNWGPLSHVQENQLLERGSLDMPDALLRLTNMDYSKPIVWPKKKLQASDDDEMANEYYLDKVQGMKAEAKEAFMTDGSMQQEAQDAGMSVEELWKEIGGDFTENYYMSAYSKHGSIEVQEGFKCPNCKSMKGKAVEDGTDDAVSLRECLTCGSFY
jgi:hypothetical protein